MARAELVSPPAGASRRHVCILTGNALCNNPRVVKEADALHAAGFSVTVLGAWLGKELAVQDKALLCSKPWTFLPVLDFSAAPAWRWPRIRTAAARRISRWVGSQTHWQLGYAGPELLAAARNLEADLYIAHSEQALWAACELARGGHRTAVDFEDWFSRDLPAHAKGGAPALLAKLESAAAGAACYVSCPSEAMKSVLAKYSSQVPIVIPNVFSWSLRERLDGRRIDRAASDGISLHWYSQTLGSGRGLEELFAAVAQLEPRFEVHLRGQVQRDFLAGLLHRLPAAWRARVFVHAPVPENELLSRIAEHDIGFAGEQPQCASRDLTITNKLMQYLLCGLAVIATETRGQLEVMRRAPGAVLTYPPGDIEALRHAILSFTQDTHALARARAESLRAAHNYYCWERFTPVLVAAAEAAMRE